MGSLVSRVAAASLGSKPYKTSTKQVRHAILFVCCPFVQALSLKSDGERLQRGLALVRQGSDGGFF